MRKRVTYSFWIEAVAAAVCGLLALLTLVTDEWIELLFGIDPDQRSGSLEWLVVAGLVLVTVVLSLRARYEWRQARPRTA